MSEQHRRVSWAFLWIGLTFAFFLWRAPGFDFFLYDGEVDHGYQVALGQQAFAGSTPGVDFFTQYGPAVSWLAAVSWKTGQVWLAEVVSWCLFLSLGYGLLWLWLGQDRHPLRKAGVLLPAMLFAPFYAKYYFVFFPALFLVSLGDGPGRDTHPSGVDRWLFAGLIAGTAGLFRIELGLALAVSGMVFLGWDDVTQRRIPQAAIGLLAGVALVTAIFCVLLIVRAHSYHAPVDFFDFEWAAVIGKMNAFNRNEVAMHGPFQRNAAGAWCLAVLAILYGGIALLGLRAHWREKYPRRIWAAGLIGCALLPHVVHNTGVTYALQVSLPAAAIIAAVCLTQWESAINFRRLLLGLYLAIGLGLWLGHANAGYVGWRQPLQARLHSLASEMPIVSREKSDPLLIAAINRHTKADERILIMSLDSRFYALSHRPWAGLIPHLAIPLPLRWQQRCVEALRRNPPALVLMTDIARTPSSSFNYFGRNPLIEDFISENYTAADKSVPGWILLKPR